LTIGYGDIYPVTFLGKALGIFISFLGVGMVAIPTGIISAGFVDQYTSIKKRTEYGYEADMNFIKVCVAENDVWNNKRIADLDLPENIIISVIKRGDDFLIPNGGAQLEAGDLIVLGAEPFNEHENIQMKEVVLKEEHPWVDKKIKDLDISRHSVIVLVKRRNKALIPNGNMKLLKNDRVFLHTQMHLQDAKYMEV
jgi:voltage-gated potassium channel